MGDATRARASTRGIQEQFEAALALAQNGNAGGAERILEGLHRRDARHPGVRNALGVLRLERGDCTGAIQLLKPLARELPDVVGIQLNLGNALVAARRAAEAIAPLRRATSRQPQSVVLCYGLARALQVAGQVAEAEAVYRTVLRLDPAHTEARSSLAAAYNFLGRYADAEREARQVLFQSLQSGGAHFNLAVSLLAQGRWGEGWAEYEWRDRTGLLDAQRRQWDRPRWEGEALEGRTILVHAEQGFGDTIQFARYLPVLRGRGAQVVLQCPAPLVALLRHAALADRVIPFGDPLPAHDLQVPLTGLCHRLRCRTVEDVVLQGGPYLEPMPDRQVELPERAGAVRVGLVWAGSATHVNDMHRSCDLRLLAPLLATPGVQWVSLQTGDRATDMARLPRSTRMHDCAGQLHDFADTASAISALDLVISVDSAVAHLAGAMGRPCWLMLPHVGLDWRWAAPGMTTAWYQNTWPVRQPSCGDWGSVAAELRARLVAMVGQSG
jgi:tetratricopeptide (TPR) repeat protein